MDQSGHIGIQRLILAWWAGQRKQEPALPTLSMSYMTRSWNGSVISPHSFPAVQPTNSIGLPSAPQTRPPLASTHPHLGLPNPSSLFPNHSLLSFPSLWFRGQKLLPHRHTGKLPGHRCPQGTCPDSYLCLSYNLAFLLWWQMQCRHPQVTKGAA